MDIKSFDDNYIFVPIAYRKLYGDDGIVPMQSFKPLSHQFIDQMDASAGDLQDQFDVAFELAADYLGEEPDFIQLNSRDGYMYNLEGTGCENASGGNDDWNGVIVAAYEGFAPRHNIIGIEIAGIIERVEKPIENILVCGNI